MPTPIEYVNKPTELYNNQYLVKTLRFRNNRDYWNTFLASVMQDPHSKAFAPLEQMHLRLGPRSANVRSTFGMFLKRSEPNPLNPHSKHAWAYRRMDPTSAGSGDPRAVVHAAPMYTLKEKEGYSKPQSTTLVSGLHRIHPRLFAGFSAFDSQPMTGVFFPFHEHYCLINRISYYDGATLERPYDSISADRRVQWPSARNLTQILQDASLKDEDGHYSEILARLRMYNALYPNNKESVLTGHRPGLLLCKQNIHGEIPIFSMLHTIKRAFDFLLCLRRQYGTNSEHSVSIVIYNDFKSGDSNPFEKIVLLTGQESLFELFETCLPNWYKKITADCSVLFHRTVVCNNWTTTDFNHKLKRLIYEIYMQQHIYLRLSNLPTIQAQFFRMPLPWNLYLTWEVPEDICSSDLFYLETLKSLVALCQQDPSIIDSMSERFKKIIRKFVDPTIDEDTLVKRYIKFALKADFGNAPYPLNTKINPRFPISIPPNFPHSNGQRPISYAIQHKQYDEFDRLLAQPGFKINQRDLDALKKTPLLTALMYSQINTHTIHPKYSSYGAIVNLLLDMQNIDLSLSDCAGRTPLIYAVQYCKNDRIISKILNHPQTNINALDNNRYSALYYAVLTHPVEDTSLNIISMILSKEDLNINMRLGPSNETVFASLTKKYTPLIAEHRHDYLRMHHYRTIIISFLNRPDLEIDEYTFDLIVRLDNYRCTEIVDIQRTLLKARKLRNGSLSSKETRILKSLSDCSCYKCKKNLIAADSFGFYTCLKQHHCRECLMGFCDTGSCGARDKATGGWYCHDCHHKKESLSVSP